MMKDFAHHDARAEPESLLSVLFVIGIGLVVASSAFFYIISILSHMIEMSRAPPPPQIPSLPPTVVEKLRCWLAGVALEVATVF